MLQRMTSPTKPCRVFHPVPLSFHINSKLGLFSQARVLSGLLGHNPALAAGLACSKNHAESDSPLYSITKKWVLDALYKMSNEKYHKVTSKNSLSGQVDTSISKFKPRIGSKKVVFPKATNLKVKKWQPINETRTSYLRWKIETGKMQRTLTCIL